MEKVICDVCGTDYPETAAQCPICGCARGDGGQTSAGNTVDNEMERPAYTYTKGGRFSKANVRKRLKAAQIQPIPEPEPDEEPEDYEDYDEEDDEEYEPASNWGLIAIVVLLLLAIIAVSSYIAIVHFDVLGSPKETLPVGTTSAAQSDPTQSQPSSEVVQVPCTGLTVTDSGISLKTLNSTWQFNVTVQPDNTTDEIRFESTDEAVVTVSNTGLVTAVGEGDAVIIISCGSFVKECRVICEFESGTEDPTQPTDPVVPAVVLKLNRTDFTLEKKGSSWNVYSGELNPADITWTSDNEQVVTVENGKVVAVGIGRTQIHAEYQDQKVSCWVSCRWTEETEPTEPTDPNDEPSEPTDPSDEPASYKLKINGRDPNYPTGVNSCEVSIKVGESIALTVVDVQGNVDVTWTASADGTCKIDGATVTGASVGKVTLTATYDGQTFTCIVRVKE